MSDTGKIVALVKALAPKADPEVIEGVVTDWLDAHPEATTTVQDGSITEAKLATTVAQKLGLISSLSDEIDDLNTALTPYIGDILTATSDSQSAPWVVDFPVNIDSNTDIKLQLLQKVASSDFSNFSLFLIYSDSTFLTVGNINVGELKTVTATKNVSYIRVSTSFSSYPATNCKVILEYWTGEKITEKVQTLESTCNSIDSRLNTIAGQYVESTKLWSDFNSIEFPFEFKANTTYYFNVINISDIEHTGNITIYLMKDGGFVSVGGDTASNIIGKEFSYTPASDYSSVRFAMTHSGSTPNYVTVSYGEYSKEYAFKNVYDTIDAIKCDYISGLFSPCVIGDSITAGLCITKAQGMQSIVNADWSWATQLFKKEHGTDIKTIAQSGATAKTIVTQKSDELATITSNDCVCVYLGLNTDSGHSIGTESDIVTNWDDTPTETFIGWYSKLLKTISHYNSPYAFGVCFGLPFNTNAYDATNKNAAIQLICENVSGWIYQPTVQYAKYLNRLTDNMDNLHYTKIGYTGYKTLFKEALNEAIYTHPTMVNKTTSV